MIPLKSDNPTLTFPLITLFLILAAVLTFAYQLSPVAQDNHFTEKLAANPSQITSRPFQLIVYRGAEQDLVLPVAATLITSIFLHGSFSHIVFNLLFLWIFGPSVEDKVGRWRFLFFYLLTGVIGTLIHIAAEPCSTVPLIGASGAIAGIMGAYLMLFPRAKILCLIFIWIIPRFIRLPAVIFLGLWIALQLWNAYTIPQGISAVAWFAHIGGFFSGLFLIRLFIKKEGRSEEQADAY
ncbi:rhomboid family intramembrane serine protease [candidate division NPL-UPA2 bacterium]|nr:rhomboid family intramembrane serine protease [candidate division NPL-UPA2 bacterium]